MPEAKLAPGIGIGWYTVSVDGQPVGQVWKDVQRYNLRRAVTVVTWKAVLPDGARVEFRGPQDTRKAALAALLAATGHGPTPADFCER